MRTSLRGILTGLGFILLVASIPWQFGLAIWDVSTLEIDIGSHMARAALVKSFATSLPQALYDMALGGGLIVLCRIDQRLEQKA